MAGILSRARNDNHNVRASEDLVKKLKDVGLKEDSISVSYDAIAMYTNISIDLALKNVLKRWDDIKSLDKDLFFEILAFCLRNNYFRYNNTTYTQISSLAMGSPLSAIVSEMVMDDIFDIIYNRFKQDILFMTKYVDDSLFIMTDQIFDDVLMTLNSFDSRLQFPFEKSDHSINFLDVICSRTEDNSIPFCHYTKPTYTDRIIHNLSNQPFSYKFNTAVNMKTKWINLSSDIHHQDVIHKL